MSYPPLLLLQTRKVACKLLATRLQVKPDYIKSIRSLAIVQIGCPQPTEGGEVHNLKLLVAPLGLLVAVVNH